MRKKETLKEKETPKEKVGLTAGELIEELKHYPADSIVVFRDSDTMLIIGE